MREVRERAQVQVSRTVSQVRRQSEMSGLAQAVEDDYAEAAQFCRFCGAGVNKYRREHEGTCQRCDPALQKKQKESTTP